MPSFLVEAAFSVAQKVFLITDKDQLPRMVTGILIRDYGVTYEVSCGTGMSWHREYELATEANVLLTSTN